MRLKVIINVIQISEVKLEEKQGFLLMEKNQSTQLPWNKYLILSAILMHLPLNHLLDHL